MARSDISEARPGGWILGLTCCGRDDGTYAAATWDEADEFREQYLDAGGHKRSAIIILGFGPGSDEEERDSER